MSAEAEAYGRHKNLKLAASELGIGWQKLYTKLRSQGISVTGDKARHGRDSDKFAAAAERDFKRMVPRAVDANALRWQAKVDFDVDGISVDVKAAHPAMRQKPSKSLSWAFSVRRQAEVCDFFCCICYSASSEIEHVLLLPSEVLGDMQTLSVACAGSKWMEFEVQPDELASFFAEFSAETQQSSSETMSATAESRPTGALGGR